MRKIQITLTDYSIQKPISIEVAFSNLELDRFNGDPKEILWEKYLELKRKLDSVVNPPEEFSTPINHNWKPGDPTAVEVK